MIPRIQLMAIFALDIIRSIWINSNLNFCYLPTYCKAYYTYCSWNSMNGKGEYVSVALHIRHFFVCLPPTCPAYPIPPTALPLVYFVKTIHHRQTNSSIVTAGHIVAGRLELSPLPWAQKTRNGTEHTFGFLVMERRGRIDTRRWGARETWRWRRRGRSGHQRWWGRCGCCNCRGASAAVTTRRAAAIGTRHIRLHMI